MSGFPIVGEMPDFGPPMTPEEERAAFLRALPANLRSRCCSPDEPWVGADHHDHGHTDCYFMNEAADEIESQREQMADMVRISWDGLMQILDTVYPADIFPTLEWDDVARDSGPRVVSLLRQINQIRSTLP